MTFSSANAPCDKTLKNKKGYNQSIYNFRYTLLTGKNQLKNYVKITSFQSILYTRTIPSRSTFMN